MKIDRKIFFDGFRDRLDSTIEQEQVDGLEFILGRMEQDPLWKHIPQIAYALATVFHETAGSFQPVEEGYYLGPKKAKAHQKTLRYFPFFGRGYVQLTWKKNYQRATRLFGAKYSADYVDSPDLVMREPDSYDVLTNGMHQGWFTTKKLDDYINGTKKDYVGARAIINGKDKAGLIAGYAVSFEKILNSAVIPASTELTTKEDRSNQQTADSIAADQKPPVENGAGTSIVVEGDGNSIELPPAEEKLPAFDLNDAKNTVEQQIPRITAGTRWLGGLSAGGIVSTTLAAFNELPPWAIFVLGILTAGVLFGLFWLFRKYYAQVFGMVTQAMKINADPTTPNVKLISRGES